MSSSTTANGADSKDIRSDDKPTVTQGEYDGGAATHSSRAAHPTQRFSPLAIVGLAYSILNSWVCLSSSMQNVVLPSGGPSAMLWALIVSTIGTFCITATMAEVAAVWVSPGGPYHHTYLFAPPRSKRSLSFAAGCSNTAGWWAITATASSIGGEHVTGIISLLNPAYVLQRWHHPGSGDFVFRQLANRAGGESDRAPCRGGLDVRLGSVRLWTARERWGTTHRGGDALSSHQRTPRHAVGCCDRCVVKLHHASALTDLEAVIESGSGPLLQIIYQATRNSGAAVTLLMFPLSELDLSALLMSSHSSALNAILSSSVVTLEVSYAIPAALLLIRGRGVLDADLDEALTTDADVGAVLAKQRSQRGSKRRHSIRDHFGYAVNCGAVVFCVVTIVL
ncbi:unnamed protein product [Tilletia caries]|nr:unnamed protein product [Tilletia caries]